MCSVDWSALGSFLGGLGALLNAGLLYWMIRVTQQYVRINGAILTATNQAVTASSAQAALSREELDLMRRQYDAQTSQRAGPIVALIDTATSQLQRWRDYVTDLRKYSHEIAASSAASLIADTRDAERDASTISLAVYRSLRDAGRLLARVDLEIAEVRRYLDHSPGTRDIERERDLAGEVHSLIDEVMTKFRSARTDLLVVAPSADTSSSRI